MSVTIDRPDFANSNPERQTMNLTELARLLGVSRSSVYAEARGGTVAGLPVIKVGHRMLIARSAVNRLFTSTDTKAS